MKKIQIKLSTLILIMSIALSTLYNWPFWKEFVGSQPQSMHAASLVKFTLLSWMTLTCLIGVVLQCSLYESLWMPQTLIFIWLSAIVWYFSREYGIAIDRTMMQNVLETDLREVRDLITIKLIVWLCVFGALPSWCVFDLEVRRTSWVKSMWTKVWQIVLVMTVALGSALLCYKDLASTLRNNHHLEALLNPFNAIVSCAKLAIAKAQGGHAITSIGLDATRAAHKVPLTVIFVVGESARSQNFQLSGYERATNPLLSSVKNIVYFGDVESCGTSTAVSVPCMFAHTARRDYSSAVGRNNENVLDILARTGVEVLWRNNNSGCKGVCDRVRYQDMSMSKDADLCPDGGCYDGILLSGLGDELVRMKGDGIVVLHQNGSHGPAYFKRVPPAFRVFEPQCLSANLQECEQQAVINSYDNTLVYTDFLLKEVIDLAKTKRGDAIVIYASDHGQSLGEKGVYLHGFPYAIAPEQQKRVPMLVWFSDSAVRRLKVNRECIAGKTVSHDNIFHSLLGVFGVSTAVYDKRLDVFDGCISR